MVANKKSKDIETGPKRGGNKIKKASIQSKRADGSIELSLLDYTCSVLTTRKTRCKRKLTCKIHSKEEKMKVRRSKNFDILLREFNDNPKFYQISKSKRISCMEIEKSLSSTASDYSTFLNSSCSIANNTTTTTLCDDSMMTESHSLNEISFDFNDNLEFASFFDIDLNTVTNVENSLALFDQKDAHPPISANQSVWDETTCFGEEFSLINEITQAIEDRGLPTIGRINSNVDVLDDLDCDAIVAPPSSQTYSPDNKPEIEESYVPITSEDCDLLLIKNVIQKLSWWSEMSEDEKFLSVIHKFDC